MSRVLHFEVSAKDPEKVIDFYHNIFGWEIKKWEGEGSEYWLITTGPDDEPGINGGFFKETEEVSGTIKCIHVKNLKEQLEKVKKYGGTIISEMTVPDAGYLAYCKDIEGTTFAMMQFDSEAK